MTSIDLNCDLGEGMNNDAKLMPYISSANIACGYHAGDEEIIKQAVELALKHDVAIGAHPGFDDKQNFGRTEQHLREDEYYNLILDQLTLFKKITSKLNASIHHVKPHGALYNMAARDKTLAATLANAVKDFDKNLILYGLSGSYLITEAEAIGLKTASEVFADRTYQDDGSLTPRSQENAMIRDEASSIQQVMQMIEQQSVISINQISVPIKAETICIHGDGDHAVEFAKLIHATLVKNQIVIKAI